MTEQELRELLKLIRQVEHYIERCLKSETEKNELRMQEQLKTSGILITDDEDESLEHWNNLSQEDREEILRLQKESISKQMMEFDL